MNTERISNALNKLHEIAGRIERSQRHGQPLPSATTAQWGMELDLVERELRQATDTVMPDTAPAKATATS